MALVIQTKYTDECEYGVKYDTCTCMCTPLCFQHKQEEADACKRRFAEDSRSDHIALLRAFQVVAP